jgi:hypothetical protein
MIGRWKRLGGVCEEAKRKRVDGCMMRPKGVMEDDG